MKSLGLSDKELELAEDFLGDDNDNDDDGRTEDQQDRTMASVTNNLALQVPSIVSMLVPMPLNESQKSQGQGHGQGQGQSQGQDQGQGQGQDQGVSQGQGQGQGGSDKDLLTPPEWFCPTPASVNPLAVAATKGKDQVTPLRLNRIYEPLYFDIGHMCPFYHPTSSFLLGTTSKPKNIYCYYFISIPPSPHLSPYRPILTSTLSIPS